MSGPIEPARPLPGHLPPVQAVQRAPREGREDRREGEPRREERDPDDAETAPGPDADGHVDLRA